MATYFSLQFNPLETVELSGLGVNLHDANLYIQLYTYPLGSEIYIPPSTRVKAVIAPDEYGWDDATALEYLQGPIINDPSLGIYTTEYLNNSDTSGLINFNEISIRPYNKNYLFENTKFNVYWGVNRSDSWIQGSASGIYTLPHNIQSSEILISGEIIADKTMKYNIIWKAIINEDSVVYTGTKQPYKIKCTNNYSDTIISDLNWSGFPAGTMPSSGITFEVPFYEDDDEKIPAIYNVYLQNSGVIESWSDSKLVELNHKNLQYNNNMYFKNLDEVVKSNIDKEGLKLIDSFAIDKDIIDRRRLSIGINDIAIKDNSFVKQGTYVSPYYPLDINLYTLSLTVDEFIPKYDNINPYDLIKYFIELNSVWEPISPITRDDEVDSKQNLIPKIFVFDKGTNSNAQVKYIDSSLVKIIRVKIVFDLTKITGEKFAPPEVKDFKCIIYDKDQLNEF
jgi:hypothetical protein